MQFWKTWYGLEFHSAMVVVVAFVVGEVVVVVDVGVVVLKFRRRSQMAKSVTNSILDAEPGSFKVILRRLKN